MPASNKNVWLEGEKNYINRFKDNDGMASVLLEEIARQSIHFALGLFYIALLLLLPLEICSSLVGAIALLGLSLSLLLSKQLIQFKPLVKLINWLSRAGELAKAGEPALWFTLGTALVILLFPAREIAIGALIVLTFGDSISTIVGRVWGRTIIRGWRTTSSIWNDDYSSISYSYSL